MPKAWPLEPGTQLVPVPVGQTQSTALTLEKNCPYLKGLPPSHHLIGKSHSITNYDVTCGRGVLFPVSYWTPHRSLKLRIGKRTLNCWRQRVWLDVSTFDPCLFTTKQIGFVLILICETSQFFVWRNKAFIFLQKSDIVVVVVVEVVVVAVAVVVVVVVVVVDFIFKFHPRPLCLASQTFSLNLDFIFKFHHPCRSA